MLTNGNVQSTANKTNKTSKWGKGRQTKFLPKAVPRAAAAYGRQLKKILNLVIEKQKFNTLCYLITITNHFGSVEFHRYFHAQCGTS